MNRIYTFSFLLLFCMSSLSAQSADPAEEILQKAQETATTQNKNILLIYHASWCGWCKRMDKAIQDPSCKDVFANNYVLVHLDVKESASQATLENPGGVDYLAEHGGDQSGLPYWVVLDENLQLLADSKVKVNGVRKNVGCPVKDQEVQHLLDVLKRTSGMQPDELIAVKKSFQRNTAN